MGKAALVTCTGCRLEDNDLAVSALAPGEGTLASFTNCVFDGNESVINAYGNQRIVLDACIIQNGTDPYGDIRLAGAASLEMRDSELRRIAGQGIVLMDTASMTLVNNVIETAYSYAIAVASTDASSGMSSQNCEVFLGRNDTDLPLGTIVGYGNTITGGVCPVSLLFLKDLAPTELSVEPGQSIQAAIDLVADGGVVTIEPGTYLEAITIDKSLSLIGPSDDSSGGVILDWDVGEAVISISSSAPIAVALSDLTFKGGNAGWGIDVGENATVEIQNMVFHDLGTAIRVRDGGSVTALHCDFTGNGSTIVIGPRGTLTGSWCTFTDNRQAILSSWSSVCTLTDSTISGCAGDGAAISASCTDLELRSCAIRDSVGSAIHLAGGEASRLHLVNSQLTGNGYGIDFTYGSCNPGDDPDWIAPPPSARAYGTVTGWNNNIPGAEEPDGNREGAFLYSFPDRLEDPSFLTEPKPEDE